MAAFTELEDTLTGRKQELREFEARAEQARVLGKAVADMQRDVLRLEKRQKAFAAIGDGHVELAAKTYDERFHATIEWQPIRSLLTGRELAAAVDVELDYLRVEIGRAEKQIEALLAQ